MIDTRLLVTYIQWHSEHPQSIPVFLQEGENFVLEPLAVVETCMPLDFLFELLMLLETCMPLRHGSPQAVVGSESVCHSFSSDSKQHQFPLKSLFLFIYCV
jgi:hypothetical protein